MKETNRHKEAFEYWLSLGGIAGDDKIRETAGKYQVNERTVWTWYKEFNWRNRADIRLNARAKKIEEKTDNAVVDRKAKELADLDDIDKIIMAMIRDTVTRDKDGKARVSIEIEDARDFSSVVASSDKIKRLKMSLIGEDLEDKTITLIVKGVDVSKFPDAS